jgi:hypothetical protein
MKFYVDLYPFQNFRKRFFFSRALGAGDRK